MDIADKAAILTDFHDTYDGDPRWQSFFFYHDLGFPYAMGIAHGDILSLSEKGESAIDQTWSTLCDMLGLDDNSQYFFEDILLASTKVVI